jgi:hypothetical protein
MGDPRRFTAFATLIASQFHGNYKVVDVAGGEGALRAALYNYGFKRITTYDPREYVGRNDPRPARVRRCDPGQKHFLRLFDYRKVEGYDLVVAMHPDGGTDHAVLYASKHQVPAVICPCCILPTAAPFQQRHTKEQWKRHLVQLAKGMDHKWLKMDIYGDSDVLILNPRRKR